MKRAQESLARSVATSELVSGRWANGQSSGRPSPDRTRATRRSDRLRSPDRQGSPQGVAGGRGAFQARAKTPVRHSRSREEIQDLGNSYLSQLRVASPSSSPRPGAKKPPQSWEWVEEKVRTDSGVEHNWTRRTISPGHSQPPARTKSQQRQDSLEEMRRKMRAMEERAKQRQARDQLQRRPSPDRSRSRSQSRLSLSPRGGEPSYAYGDNPTLMTFLRSLALQHHHKMFVRLGAVNGLHGLDRVDLGRVGLSQADQRIFLRALKTLPTNATQADSGALTISFGSPLSRSDDDERSPERFDDHLENATAQFAAKRRAREEEEELVEPGRGKTSNSQAPAVPWDSPEGSAYVDAKIALQQSTQQALQWAAPPSPSAKPEEPPEPGFPDPTISPESLSPRLSPDNTSPVRKLRLCRRQGSCRIGWN